METLTQQEKLVLSQMRDANETITKSKGMISMHVGVFVGTPNNCVKVQEMQNLVATLQIRHPELPIETFIVPIPQDEYSAEMMRRAVVDNVTEVFNSAFPDKDDLN